MLANFGFPIIKHISDVRPHIVGCDAINVIEKEDYDVIQYFYQDSNTFHTGDKLTDMMRRECRGLVFNKNGKLIRRAFHKFFNIGEKPETQPELLAGDIMRQSVLQKLDGSMVTPLPLEHGVRWATKMGLSDVALSAERFVARQRCYTAFADYCIARDLTPIFEWMDAHKPIVIQHEKSNMVLLAVRHNTTGEYMSYAAMSELAEEYYLPLVKLYDFGAMPLGDFIAQAKEARDDEGFVIRYGCGQMVKMKSDWYVAIHNALEIAGSQRKIIDLILKETVDDVIASVPPEFQGRFVKTVDAFWKAYNDKLRFTQDYYAATRSHYGDDRKAFALGEAKKMDSVTRTLLFNLWDGRDLKESARAILEKNLYNETRFEEYNKLWLNLPATF